MLFGSSCTPLITTHTTYKCPILPKLLAITPTMRYTSAVCCTFTQTTNIRGDMCNPCIVLEMRSAADGTAGRNHAWRAGERTAPQWNGDHHQRQTAWLYWCGACLSRCEREPGQRAAL